MRELHIFMRLEIVNYITVIVIWNIYNYRLINRSKLVCFLTVRIKSLTKNGTTTK